jgi:hypothetical protein
LVIQQRDITLNDVTASTKVYDGNTTASITGGTFGNIVAGETLALTGNGYFNSPNVNDVSTVTVNDVANLSKVDGTGLWSNYNLTTNGPITSTATGQIAPKDLQLIGTSVADKAFDGTTEAQLVNPGQLDGLVNNEQLGLSATADFGDANVGIGKPVSIQASLQDSNNGMASNYRLIVPTGITANITGAVEPTPTPAPIVPVVPSNANTNSVSFAAANNNFQLAGAEGQCSAETLELCECEGGPDIQICYEPSKAP